MSRKFQYKSGLTIPIETLIKEKRALGHKYDKESLIFYEFDRFLLKNGVLDSKLPQDVVEKWLEKRPNEKVKNQRYRLNFTKRFCSYLQLHGYDTYYPELSISSRNDSDFVPYIFSNDELSQLINYFDCMKPSRQYPNAHIVYPLLFKTLICCGLRLGEVAKLQVKDINLVDGTLLVREAKHNKQRHVPLSKSVWTDYMHYFDLIHANSSKDDYFFPNARGNSHHTTSIYEKFREALWACGISHKGRGYGPRVHDFRHTFAVRCMQKLEKTKGDIVTSLPYLSTYLGHYNIGHTQVYLRLIAENYPEFIQKQCDYLGNTIPTLEGNHEKK